MLRPRLYSTTAMIVGWLSMCIISLGGVAHGESATKIESPAWSNSSVSYRNTISALTLDPSAELTYNPYYVMGLNMAPRWDLNPDLFLSAGFGLSHELTNADMQTQRGETWPSDLNLNLGTPGWLLPGAKLRFSGSLGLIIPFSPLSKAQSLLTTIGPRMGVSRTFRFFEGVTIAYSGGMSRSFYEYTTAGRDAPTIIDCRGVVCASLVNTGVRNARWRQNHSLSLNVQWLPWWGTSASAGVAISHLFPAERTAASERVPIAPTDERYASIYGIESSFRLGGGLGLAFGLSTAGPQLAPNSTYYDPFYNRFSQIYVDLRFALGAWLAEPDRG